ncbi:MAG: hypothetical protein WA004_20995 [Saprospiraceae bacterium]
MKPLYTLLLTAICGAAIAQSTFDLSFGANGSVTTDFGRLPITCQVMYQSTGNLLLGGVLKQGDYDHALHILRYLPDGSADPSFGNAGVLLHPSEYYAVPAVQEDDKILVTGNNGYGFRITRYLPDGALDVSFGNGGTTSMTWDGDFWNSHPRAIAVQPDGKILVSGDTNSEYPEYGQFALTRFLPGGAPDTTFGINGLVFIDTLISANGLAVQPDGKILVATQSTYPYIESAIARLNEDGSLDETFGEGGVTTGVDYEIETKSVLLLPDGDMILCTDISLAKFGPDGQPDLSFGSNGVVSVVFSDVGLEAVFYDGYIFVAKTIFHNQKLDFSLLRFTADGQADPAFGENGQIFLDIWQNDYFHSLALLPNGNLAIAGISDHKLSLALIQPNGELVQSFAGDGILTAYFGGYRAIVKGVGRQSDGKLVAAGGAVSGDVAMARYNDDGSLDPTFGENGKVVTDLKAFGLTPQTMALGPDDRIFVGGKRWDNFLFLMRYHPDGSLDTGFGENGMLTQDATGAIYDGLRALLILPDGKILWTGKIEDNAILSRLLPDGSPDPSFGENGRITLPDVELRALVLLPDGKILAGGDDDYGNDVFRFLPNGSPDPSFNFIGKANTPLEGAWALAVRPDGKILAAGGKNGNPAMVQLLPNGPLDSDFQFSNNLTTLAYYYGAIFELTLLPGGKTMFAGVSYEFGDLFIGRIQSDGALDLSFYNHGYLSPLDHLQSFSEPHLLIQPDEKVVLASTRFYATYPDGISSDADFRLVRFPSDPHVGVTNIPSLVQGLILAPNPVSNTGTLSYQLNHSVPLSLLLFDGQGKKAHTFFEKSPRSAGSHAEALSFPPGLAPGVYWLSLEAANQAGNGVKVIIGK